MIPEGKHLPTLVEDLDRALELITGYFDSAWMIDHLQFGNQNVLEGFTTLTYMAARHPGLKFGHTVLCQSFRNPALLAKMAATLQLLTGGRFILGLGAGWNKDNIPSHGYDTHPDTLKSNSSKALHYQHDVDGRQSQRRQHYTLIIPCERVIPARRGRRFQTKMLCLTVECWTGGCLQRIGWIQGMRPGLERARGT
jgi:hypothetical protein